MLVKLANDPNFDKLLKDFVSGHLKDPSSVKSILQDLDKFNQFLAEEQKVLEYYKYTPVATVDTLFTALSSRRWVDPSKVNVDFIKMSISALRDKTCSIRSNIATSQKQSDQLSMITMGIYGTGLVVVDGLAVWFSVGMASFIAPTSASIGGGMVGQAVYSLATAK